MEIHRMFQLLANVPVGATTVDIYKKHNDELFSLRMNGQSIVEYAPGWLAIQKLAHAISPGFKILDMQLPPPTGVEIFAWIRIGTTVIAVAFDTRQPAGKPEMVVVSDAGQSLRSVTAKEALVAIADMAVELRTIRMGAAFTA